MKLVIRSEGPEDTRHLGYLLGQVADAGTAVSLEGDLGAGKTLFCKGVGEGLGVSTRVTSPTFVLLAVHEGRLPLFHADVYRLGDASELDLLGFDETSDGVLLVEWASRFPESMPADHLALTLEIDDDARDVQIVTTGPRSERVLLSWAAAWERLRV